MLASILSPTSHQAMTDLVRLRCVKEGSKLRMKITSPGYSPAANCQCPRDIRVEGGEYTVPRSDIALANMRGKFFYRINGKNIRPATETSKPGSGPGIGPVVGLKVYGDENLAECIICMSDTTANPNLSFVIFAPCGHYCSCSECARQLQLRSQPCPLCRGAIAQLVTKDQLQ